MKSRLLPPPVADDRDIDEASSPLVYARREADRAEGFIDDASIGETRQVTPTAETTPSVAQSAPEVSARPSGRLAVVAILLVCVASIAYSLWSTFLRDAAYGVVTGKVTAISPPWSGTLTAVYVRAGDTVRQGDVLAVVEAPQLQASIDRLSDELRSTQAELDAQAALLSLAARERGNATEEIRADYFDLRGELLAEQARFDELTSKLRRREELADRRAFSAEEVESLGFVKQGLADKIENLQQAVAALESRLSDSSTNDHDAAQLKPWLAKIENLQAEIHRLRENQSRGTLRAPFSGKVVDVSGRVGARATSEQPALELLPDDSLEIVLYVDQGQLDAYSVGQQVEVIVEPSSEPIDCRIDRIGHRLEKLPAHIVGRHGPDARLLPVYLIPTTDDASATALRVGSSVRLPASLFGP